MSHGRTICAARVFAGVAVCVSAFWVALPSAIGANRSPVSSSPTVSPRQVEFFETRVRPIFAAHCQKCHGAQTQKGGLRLDSRESVLKGGDSGPVVVPGKPDESPLIEAVNYRGLEMPPTGKLSPRQIAALAEWVQMGAPWPESKTAAGTKPAASASRRSDFAITDEDRAYWAFQPLGDPRPPHVGQKTWAANPIDAFILARLEAKGLEPNPPADPRTLVRRLFFDLIGLPPSPEEIDAFVADYSPRAYERLVDDLLSRKQYGERWGRHWLDVARFAQTNGYERDSEKPEAWRYRDYVIGAFNDDKPYDRFVEEQLAGDELPDATTDSVIATGFYRLGIWDDEPDDQKAAAWDELDEMVRTTGGAFLGLTLGCARCHNHMFDPISQEDYYRFAAIFRNVEPYGVPASPTHRTLNEQGVFTPLTTPAEYARWQSRQVKLSTEFDEVKKQLAVLRKRVVSRRRMKETDRKNARPSKEQFDRELTAAERDLKTRLDADAIRLKGALQVVNFSRALSVRECGRPLMETRVLVRGNVAVPGKKVEPQLPTVLGGRKLECGQPLDPGSAPRDSLRRRLSQLGVRPTLGLRRQLAEWIAAKDNPLTPRVMMNRLWQEHFGRGIVRSADNFGRAGTPPTHPDLLAWLARDFVDGGWRLKRMHKRIVMSNAYRLSSTQDNARARAADGDNDLFWRQHLRRLDAEAIRDEMLAVSGRLNLRMGGRGIFPRLSPEVLATQSRPGFGWDHSSPGDESRRSVYIFLKRTLMVPFLEAFDYTNTAESLGTRPVTTVAPQALLLLNSEFANQQAAALAQRVCRESGSDPHKAVPRLFRIALGRLPTDKELTIALALLGRDGLRGQDGKPQPERLRSLCLVVLNLNEFVYVD